MITLKCTICIITSGCPGRNAVHQRNKSLVISLSESSPFKSQVSEVRAHARGGWLHGTPVWRKGSQVFLPGHGSLGVPGMYTAFLPSLRGFTALQLEAGRVPGHVFSGPWSWPELAQAGQVGGGEGSGQAPTAGRGGPAKPGEQLPGARSGQPAETASVSSHQSQPETGSVVPVVLWHVIRRLPRLSLSEWASSLPRSEASFLALGIRNVNR